MTCLTVSKPVLAIGTCRKCSAVVRVADMAERWAMTGEAGHLARLNIALCPNGHKLYVKPIRGTVRPDIKCGGKCRSSKGPNCECSCGGLNHGANY